IEAAEPAQEPDVLLRQGTVETELGAAPRDRGRVTPVAEQDLDRISGRERHHRGEAPREVAKHAAPLRSGVVGDDEARDRVAGGAGRQLVTVEPAGVL